MSSTPVPLNPVDVVKRAYDAVERADMATLLEVFAPDCEFIDITEPSPFQGIAAFEEYMQATFDVLPGFHPENARFVTDGDRVAAELEIVATHRGEFLGVPGTGSVVRWPAAAFYTVDQTARQITREAYYYDVASVRALLQANAPVR
jgi:steroid delta-isomerase-like uncharacterized protein